MCFLCSALLIVFKELSQQQTAAEIDRAPSLAISISFQSYSSEVVTVLIHSLTNYASVYLDLLWVLVGKGFSDSKLWIFLELTSHSNVS